MNINKFTPPTIQKWGKLGFVKSLVLMVVMIVTTSNLFAQAHFENIDGLRYLIDENAKTATLVASPDETYSVLENKEFTDSIFKTLPQLQM